MLTVYQPQDPELRKYIECYYVYTRCADDEPVKYLTFPSVFTIVSISRNSITRQTDRGLITEYSSINPIETNIVCAFRSPVCVEYVGQINEITIYFKPLGINAFLTEDLCNYNTERYADFDPFGDLKGRMIEILGLVDVERRLVELEQYWLSKLKGFRHPVLKGIVADMLDAEPIPITGLAYKYGISRSTLNKYFDRHICKSPSEFRKVVRFRRAMHEHLSEQGRKRLTDVTYSLDYFDQSHMIKDFRSLTGYSPAKFFSSVSKLENGQISWLFL